MKFKRTQIAALVVSAAALVSIAVHEDYVGEAMIPVPGDVPTIGFGETAGVKMGDKTTPVRALVQLLDSAEVHADGVRKCMDGAELYPHEFNAYVSLAYNIGVPRLCGSSIPKKVKAQQYEAACDTIKDFVCGPATQKTRALPGQKCFHPLRPLKVLKGLQKRREQEYAMCMGKA
jgi:lysozyme